MVQNEIDAIAAFVRATGVTRCPTACAAPTQATVAAADRLVLRQWAEQREATRQAAREERLRRVWPRRVGAAA